MSTPRKGFTQLPRLLQDIDFTREEAAILFHLHLRKGYEPRIVEFQPGQPIQVAKNALIISVRELEKLAKIPKSSVFRALKRLESRGLIHRTSIYRAVMIIRLPSEEEMGPARIIAGQLARALTGETKREFRQSGVSTGTTVGQHGGTRQNVPFEPKTGGNEGMFKSRWDSSWDSRNYQERITPKNERCVTDFVDNSGAWCGKPGRPVGRVEFFVNRLGQAIALAPDAEAAEGVENQSWVNVDRFPMVPGPSSQSAADNVYAVRQTGLKIPAGIPTYASVRQLRIYPHREDFDSHAEWFRAQYEPMHDTSRILGLQPNRTPAFRQVQVRAGAFLRNIAKVGIFELHAAVRDVHRNGYVGSCAWEIPAEGILAYLATHLERVLARIERLTYQRERRRLAAERGRQRRKFQARAPKVHAFRAAWPDRRARRREMDRLRELYPPIFAEIPRSSVSEFAVCAQLWGQQ